MRQCASAVDAGHHRRRVGCSHHVHNIVIIILQDNQDTVARRISAQRGPCFDTRAGGRGGPWFTGPGVGHCGTLHMHTTAVL